MEEAELERIFKDLFKRDGFNFRSERRYHEFNWFPAQDGKPELSYSWFCAFGKETTSDTETVPDKCSSTPLNHWSFYYQCLHKRLTAVYTSRLLFHAIAQHNILSEDPEMCTTNPTECVHTVTCFTDFLCQPLEDQKKTIDVLIREGLFADEMYLIDNTLETGQNVIFKILSRPSFKELNKQGYFEKITPIKYTPIIEPQLSEFAYKGVQYLRYVHAKFEEGIIRGELADRHEIINLLRDVIEQAYIP